MQARSSLQHHIEFLKQSRQEFLEIYDHKKELEMCKFDNYVNDARERIHSLESQFQKRIQVGFFVIYSFIIMFQELELEYKRPQGAEKSQVDENETPVIAVAEGPEEINEESTTTEELSETEQDPEYLLELHKVEYFRRKQRRQFEADSRRKAQLRQLKALNESNSQWLHVSIIVVQYM